MSEEHAKRSTRGKRWVLRIVVIGYHVLIFKSSIDVSKLAELEAEQDEFWGKGGQGGDLFAVRASIRIWVYCLIRRDCNQIFKISGIIFIILACNYVCGYYVVSVFIK